MVPHWVHSVHPYGDTSGRPVAASGHHRGDGCSDNISILLVCSWTHDDLSGLLLGSLWGASGEYNR